MKKYKSKILISIISFSIAVFCVEFYVRSKINNLNFPKVYSQYSEYKLNENEYSGRTEYIRDYSLEHYKGNNDLEVILIGDSFTNGGNVVWDDSYPYKLYQKLGREVSVRNFGVCSSTTKMARQRVEDFFQSNEYDKNKKYIFGVLVGAGDFLSTNLETPIVGINGDKLRHVEMEEGVLGSIFNNLYFFKMTVFVFKEAFDFLYNKSLSFSQHYKYLNSIDECSLDSQCIIDKLKKIQGEINNQEFEFLLYLSGKFLVRNKSFGSQAMAEVLNLNLTLMKSFPALMNRDDFVMSTLSLARVQSKIPMSEILISLRESNNFSDSESQKKNNELFKAAESWTFTENQIIQNANDQLKRLIKTVRSNGADVFLINYPIDYKSINENIKQVSSEEDITLIDINNLFDEKAIGLIDDWEHCTAEGNDIIANEVSKYLNSKHGN